MTEHTDSGHKIADLMNRLGLSGHQLQNVKLGPGVVGRNSSIAWVFEVVMLAGVIAAAFLHSTTMLALSLAGAILVAIVIVVCNVYFCSKNPAAGLLEGAQFLEFHHMQMAAKGIPLIEASAPPIPSPVALPPSPDQPERQK
jgi:hypothetical protein